MVIDGRNVANAIYSELKERVATLKDKAVTPTMAIILVGENPASVAYIAQKQQSADLLGVKIELYRYDTNVTADTLLTKIRELNNNQNIHGIIVQRPLPEYINHDYIQNEIDDKKDIDGFKSTSPFQVPVAMAVVRILNNAALFENGEEKSNFDVKEWLKTKNITLLGKGSTAGEPIAHYLREIGVAYELIDSRTENPTAIMKQADIVISSVGKIRTVKPEALKQGVILVGVGISKDGQGKMHGDYEENEIQNIASYYTKTPGGVGPVNVAMLLYNLVTAAEE